MVLLSKICYKTPARALHKKSPKFACQNYIKAAIKQIVTSKPQKKNT